MERVSVKQLERPVERRPVGGGITPEDFIRRPELILAIAAILLVIGAIGPWTSFLGVETSGWAAGGGKLSIFFALIILGSVAIKLGYIRNPTLESLDRDVLPILSVSTLTGLGAFVGGIIGVSARGGTAGWGLYLTLFAGLVALFAAFRVYTQPGAGIGRRAL